MLADLGGEGAGSLKFHPTWEEGATTYVQSVSVYPLLVHHVKDHFPGMSALQFDPVSFLTVKRRLDNFVETVQALYEVPDLTGGRFEVRIVTTDLTDLFPLIAADVAEAFEAS